MMFRPHYEPSVLSVRCNKTQAEYYCSYLFLNATTALAWRQMTSRAHGHALIRLNLALVNSLLVTKLQLTAHQPSREKDGHRLCLCESESAKERVLRSSVC